MSINIIGERVAAYHVRGKEQDISGRWIGADLVLDVPPVGRFVVNIVTKQYFVDERLARELDQVERLEELLNDDNPQEMGIKPPFVLNDSEITDELLQRKFGNRIIELDLANSLWHEGPIGQ